MAYQKPIRPLLVVSPDKLDKFLAQKPDPAAKDKILKMAALFDKISLKK